MVQKSRQIVKLQVWVALNSHRSSLKQLNETWHNTEIYHTSDARVVPIRYITQGPAHVSLEAEASSTKAIRRKEKRPHQHFVVLRMKQATQRGQTESDSSPIGPRFMTTQIRQGPDRVSKVRSFKRKTWNVNASSNLLTEMGTAAWSKMAHSFSTN